MPFDRIAEQRIREAIEQGWLNDLPNRGQRLDLDEYFRTPEHLRLAYSVLKSANCLPEEVELRHEIAQLEHALTSTERRPDRTRLERDIADRTLRLNLLLERARRRNP